MLPPNSYIPVLSVTLQWSIQSHNRDWPSRHPQSEAFIRKAASPFPKSSLMFNIQKVERRCILSVVQELWLSCQPSHGLRWRQGPEPIPSPSQAPLLPLEGAASESSQATVAWSGVYAQRSWLSRCSTSWLSLRGKN